MTIQTKMRCINLRTYYAPIAADRSRWLYTSTFQDSDGENDLSLTSLDNRFKVGNEYYITVEEISSSPV